MGRLSLIALLVAFGPSALWISYPTIAGRVVRPGGAPVPGAEVVLECAEPFRSTLAPLASARTDADGRFELAAPAGGEFRMIAVEYDGERVAARNALEGVRAGGSELELVLPPCVLDASVVDDQGTPVAQFNVRCTSLDPAGKPTVVYRDGTDGAARVPLTPGKWSCTFTARRDRVPAKLEVTLPLAGPLRVVMPRMASVRGTVVDGAGNPVAQARILVDEGSGDVAHLENVWWAAQDPGLRAVSTRDGGFGLRVASGEPILLAASRRGFAPSAPLAIELAPGEERDGLVLQLGSLAHLSGELLALDGAPLAERTITLGDPSRFPRPYQVRTDAAGRFEADVEPGSLRVEIDGDPRPSCVRALTLASGESRHVSLALGGAPVLLHGRLPPGRALIRPSLDVWSQGGRESVIANLRADEYEVLVPEPGLYYLSLHDAAGNIEETVDVPSGAEWRHDMPSAQCRLAGRVVDGSGDPLADVAVQASRLDSSDYERSTTASDGAFALQLFPGDYFLTLCSTAEDFRAPEPRLVHVTPEPRADLELVAPRLGVLEGSIRRADGGPLDEAWLSFTGARPILERKPLADSRFHLPVDADRGWMWAEGRAGQDWFLSAEPLLVEPGRSPPATLELLPCTFVRVRPRDAAGPLPSIQVEALDLLGRATPSRMLAPGERGLLLRPGSYTLRVLHERLFERPLDVPEGLPTLELDWQLE